MSYLCEDCGEELRADLHNIRYLLPSGWCGVWSCVRRGDGGQCLEWEAWTQHKPCSEECNAGRVAWVPHPSIKEKV